MRGVLTARSAELLNFDFVLFGPAARIRVILILAVQTREDVDNPVAHDLRNDLRNDTGADVQVDAVAVRVIAQAQIAAHIEALATDGERVRAVIGPGAAEIAGDGERAAGAERERDRLGAAETDGFGDCGGRDHRIVHERVRAEFHDVVDERRSFG